MSFFYDKPLNSVSLNWAPGCASDDFKNIAITNLTDQSSGVYISNDYGQTWYNPTQGLSTNGSSVFSRGVICSDDFQRLTYIRQGGRIYTSTDYGISWTQNSEAARQYYSICGTPDLSKQAVVVNGGSIYSSNNSGSTWTALSTAGTKNWRGICCSSDFTKLAAIVYSGNIWISSDSGSTWTEIIAAGAIRNWRAIACSSDGVNLVASVESVDNGTLWISKNGGTSWSAITLPAGANKSYNHVACSADFKYIIAGSYEQNNFIYSTDFGVTWTTDTNGLNLWHSCLIKGNKFIVARNPGNIYVGRFAYDATPYLIGGESELVLTKSLPVIGANAGLLIDKPLDYTNAFYRFDFSFGTVDTYDNQTSTGINTYEQMARSGTMPVFKNLSGTFPVNGAPSQVIDISNAVNSSAVQYLQTNGVGTFLSFSNISYSVWIRPKIVLSSGKKFSIANISPRSATSVFDILIDGSNNKVQLNINNTFTGNFAVSSTALVVGTWYHLVCTYNSLTGIGNIFINGTLESSVSYGVILNDFSALIIGMRWGFNNSNGNAYQGYNGTMTYLNIFHREITQSEVNFLYNNPSQPFTNINANSLSQLYKGGYPFFRGQAPIGDSPYSSVSYNYYTATPVTTPQVAPYYTCYTIGTYQHTLQPNTTRIFVIAIGGGGGGSGGNYYIGSNDRSGGAGGGGGGGGLGYTYYAVSSTDILNITVGDGGNGGENYDLGGNNIHLGGNGSDGSPSIFTLNSVEICSGRAGARSYHQNNPNTNNAPYNTNIGTNYNNIGGIGGVGGTNISSSNLGVNGGINGIAGTNGNNDPENDGSSATAGTGGLSGSRSGIQISGKDLISNDTLIKFFNTNFIELMNGSTFRTTVGKGGNGGTGEGRDNASNLPGEKGNPGVVLIFEYAV